MMTMMTMMTMMKMDFIYQRYDTYKVCSNLGFKKEDLQSAFAKNNSKLKLYILTFLNDFVKIVLSYF